MGKLNLVYFSAAGTTKTVATHLAKSIESEITEYDLLRNPQKQPVTFESDSQAIFAVPVYAGRIPAIAAEMLRQFQGKTTPAIAVVVYGNREYDDALLELKNLLCESGFSVVAAAAIVAQHSIFPSVASGRPDMNDKEQIAIFGHRCGEALRGVAGNSLVEVKGNTPYRQPKGIPVKPSGNAKCNGCGACVEFCPVKAIAPETPHKTNKERCISCAACIAVCPKKARAFRGLMYSIAGKAFGKSTKTRKEPEFYYSK